MMILQEVDMNILLWIQEHLRVDVLTPLWKVITFLGNGGWFWIVASVLLICFGKTRKAGITAVLSLALGFLITNLLLKNIVARPRPFDSCAQILPLITKPTDYSFPSGHTCASFACALVYLRMMPEKFGVPSVILAGMVAFSRLYLGVHYPGDVLAGFLVAVFTSITACFLVRKYEETKQGQAAGLSGAWKGRK